MQRALIGILGILVLFLAASNVRLSQRVRLLEGRPAAGKRAVPGPPDRVPVEASTPAAAPAAVAKAPESAPARIRGDSRDARAEAPKSAPPSSPSKGAPPRGTLIVDVTGHESLVVTPQASEPGPDSAAGRRPGFLGIQGEDVPGGGVKINSVLPFTVAGASGLQPDDVIVEVNGERVDSLAALSTMIRGAGEGAPASLRIRRNGAEFYLGVQLTTPAPR